MEENAENMENGLNEVLVEQEATKSLFPRISKDLSKMKGKGGSEAMPAPDFTTGESILINEEGQKVKEERASKGMGIHDFDTPEN